MTPFHDVLQAADIILCGRRPLDPKVAASARAKRLAGIVAYARKNVPFYRRLFDGAGPGSSDIRTLDDLGKIPVTTRLELKAAPVDDILSAEFRSEDLCVFRTSGATGIPLAVYQSRSENFLLHLVKLRTLRALGLRWRDKMIKVRNQAYTRRPATWKALQGLGWLRQKTVDSGTPEEVAAALRGKHADILMGYSGTLARVAQIFAGEPDGMLRPRFLVGGSETMTPFLRAEIQKGFGAPVLDTYICQEAGMLAWECPVSGRYHVVDDTVVAEVLRDGSPCRPGEEGEVVVTSLVCRAMPIIRYRLDDRVRLAQGDCPCGRRGLALDRVLGKTQDYFWLPGGREFNPWDLSGLWMGRAPWLRQFEVVQEKPDSVVMRIVPAGTPPPEEIEALAGESRGILGPGVRFRVEFLPEIKPSPEGKYRTHRSLVRSIYDNPRDREWLGPS
jgi:phenylacetate-CoA ligase